MAYIAIYKCPKCTTLGEKWYNDHRKEKLDYPVSCDNCGNKILYDGEVTASRIFISKDADMSVTISKGKAVSLAVANGKEKQNEIIIKGDKDVNDKPA